MSDEIIAKARSVRELLESKKYGIDEYQREYEWETRHVSDMLEDFESRFLSAWDPKHERKAVKSYPQYFLGPMVMSELNGQRLIVDGQQRITTLTLLLIFLQHLQNERDQQVDVSKLIFSEAFGEKSFNIDMPERAEVLGALYAGEDPHRQGISESAQNIIARYRDIEDLFPEALQGDALLYFIDWLIEKVQVVVITAFSANEAYTIFETMNDRGLSLAPTDMLKGYLVAHIEGAEEKKKANHLWRDKVYKLHEFDEEADADFLKAWLRAQYADSIRASGRDRLAQDFEKIGTGFHKWVRDQQDLLGLETSADYRDFVHKRFAPYADHYLTMLAAARSLTEGLEYIYYNNDTNFTFQYPLMLAAICPNDSEDTARTKMRLVSGFCDIYIARRAVNYRAMRYSSIRYSMFNLMKDIRRLDVPALAERLKAEVDAMEEDFSGFADLRLNRFTKRYIRHILARMTRYVEARCGVESSFETYVSKDIDDRFQIEHIWADKHEYHEDEFDTVEAFQKYRDRVGGLLLLPQSFNASYGDAPYDKKLPHYYGQNFLAASLHPNCYENHPRFLKFIEQTGLPFRPHEQFRKDDLDARQELYQRLAERIWSTDRFEREIAGVREEVTE